MKDSERIKKWEELSADYSLIPLKGKRPIEKGWQKYCVSAYTKLTTLPDLISGK